jgi:decaprenylphospho-beta-D-erythro-pentofuranosid-2-ulose 2-reductase
VRDGVGDVQSVVVFGGTSEIALAVVHRLARRRCRRVVLAVRDYDAGDKASQELATSTLAVAVTSFDAAAVGTHEYAVARAFAAAGGDVDLVIVAFGQLGDRTDFDTDPDGAVALSQVNYVGAVSVLLRVAVHLRRQGYGTIVVLSSVAGVRVRAANYVYGASKAGLDAFAQGLGDSLTDSGVDVIIVRPGFVRTKMTAGMTPAPFAVGPDDVARAIETSVRARRSIVWVPSTLRAVFLVLRVLPRRIWRRIPMGAR